MRKTSNEKSPAEEARDSIGARGVSKGLYWVKEAKKSSAMVKRSSA